MGTVLRVVVAAPTRHEGIEAIESAFVAVRRADTLLSTWREDSEIASLNQAPVGRPFPITGRLRAVLGEVHRLARVTNGAFDPAIGSLVDAWDLRGSGRMPSLESLARARNASGMQHFILSRAGTRPTVTRTHEHAWIDTGGFGKGVALKDACEALQRAGIKSASLNFGGQLVVFGPDQRGLEWSIPVAHPGRRTEPISWLHLRSGSVSTSSQSERSVAVGGQRLGHILDPRTGRPTPAWGSVTVIARDPVIADVFSTALLVLGPDRGLQWARGRRDVAVLFLVEGPGGVERRGNAELEKYLVTDSPHTRRT
jgi:FAD:protein FMN transferase